MIKADPEVWARRFGQVAPVALASWAFQSPHFTATEGPTLERLERAGVPREKYAYYLATAKEVMSPASSFGGDTAGDEELLAYLERVWREVPPNTVEAIYNRARELGEGQISLMAAYLATLELAPPQVIEWAGIPTEVGATMGEELYLATGAWTLQAAYTDKATTDWCFTQVVGYAPSYVDEAQVDAAWTYERYWEVGQVDVSWVDLAEVE